MAVTSISIGFHLNGIKTARKNAHEMQAIMDEKALIETDFNQKFEKVIFFSMIFNNF